jgi:hypothetical protein
VKTPKRPSRTVPAKASGLKDITALRSDVEAVRRGRPDWPRRLASARDLTLLVLLGNCLEE